MYDSILTPAQESERHQAYDYYARGSNGDPMGGGALGGAQGGEFDLNRSAHLDEEAPF